MPATARTTTPMPTPIPAIAAWDRPEEVDPPAASPEEVALAADPEVEDGGGDDVDEPVSAVAAPEVVDSVLAEVTAGVVVGTVFVEVVTASVAGVEGVEGVGVGVGGVLGVTGSDGVGICEVEELGTAAPFGGGRA